MIDDLYDNGELDLSWNCERLLDALNALSESSRPRYLSMLDELDGRLRAECTAWPVPVNNEPELTVGSTSVAPASEYEATPYRPRAEFKPADSGSEEIYSVPWEIVVAGVVSGGLVVLIGAAAVREWRLLRLSREASG